VSFRFRRRIRIAPGLHLNVGKRGVSVSAGVRGASITAGRRGVYRNVGIPGTGLSHRQRMDTVATSKNTSRRAGSSAAVSASTTVQYRINVDEKGQLRFFDENEAELDPAMAKTLCRLNREQIRDRLAVACEQLNRALEDIARLHLATPAPTRRPVYDMFAFGENAPSAKAPEKAGIAGFLWPPHKRRVQARNARQRAAHVAAVANWESRRNAHNENEALRKRRFEVEVSDSTDAMADVLSERLEAIAWPRETAIDFDIGSDNSTITIDVDLPAADELPDAEWQVPARQYRLLRKPLSSTRLRQIYRDYVHASAFRILGEIFASLPTVEQALVSGYTQVVNGSTGHIEDQYLYSVTVSRAMWQGINFDDLGQLNPVACLEVFALRRKMTKTGIFKPVTPMTEADFRDCSESI